MQAVSLSLANIEKAAGIIPPVFRDSPQFAPESLGDRLGCRLVVKIETLNPVRSFKARGPQFLMSQLQGRPKLVCATAGNFGQGMAIAARDRGLPITIFTPADANPRKIERMRGFGADVRGVSGGLDAVAKAARAFSAETGALLVEDGREPAIAEGAGTIGVELLRWTEPLAAVLVPLGDGALLGGVAAWIKAHSPATRMIGVSSANAPAMERSWRQKKVVSCKADSIADGLAIETPFKEAVRNLVQLADDVLLVEDRSLIDAMRLAHEEIGIVLEPSGAAGIAALMAYREQFTEGTVATILTGGNVSDEHLRRLVD
ncbi:MAG TPA: threonine/serine dehydratase [Dongiaceae bacterium]